MHNINFLEYDIHMEKYSTDIEEIISENPLLFDAASKLYTDLEYHNFTGHVLGTIVDARN